MSIKKKTNYRIIFADLDDTLIQTYTGNTFPKGVWDMKFKFDVLDKIKKFNPEYFFIVTNQGGIGTYVDRNNFETKLQYVCAAIKEYTGIKNVNCTYCDSIDKDCEDRKPNPGMAYTLLHCENLFIENGDFTIEDMLMIGDADGGEGAFNDSDKQFAKNVFTGIDFLGVRDL